MTIDLAKVRADTPACQDQAFLDNAGSALTPTVVTDAVIDHLRLEQEVGGYVAAEQSATALANTRISISDLINCPADQIALQTSATAAWSRAVSSLPLQPGDRVLISSAEYASNVLPFLQIARSLDLTIEIIPNGPDGTASPDALADMLDARVKAVCVTHAPSQNGLVVDAVRIGDAIRASNFQPWYLLDACQSIGQLRVNSHSIGADFISATGRKWLRAPRGTGFLFVSRRTLAELEPHPIDMFGALWDGDRSYTAAATVNRFESFETSYANQLGLGVAVDYALQLGIDNITARVTELAEDLRAHLAETPGVRVVDRGQTTSGIVTFALPDPTDPIAIVRELRSDGITVTALGPATNPKDFATFDANCVLRASPHVYNTAADNSQLCSGLAKTNRVSGGRAN